MKKFLHSLILFCFITNISFAQLDGSGIAPNFTLTDIDGTAHTLYDYLDQGKVVVLDFFATWCGPCNNNANAVEEVYVDHGPDGDNTIMMLLLESDDSTPLTDLQTYMTNHSVTCPAFDNVAASGVKDMYEIGYYPTYYVVYSDRSYVQVSGGPTTIKTVLTDAIAQNPGLSTTTYDARVLEFESPKGSYCQSSITPVITIQNYGTEAMTSLTIYSKIDGNTEKTYNWTGSLDQYEIQEITLAKIEGITDGAHEFTFDVESPNGEVDDDDLNNEENSSIVLLSEGTQTTATIRTDLYPTETSWEIKKGSVVYAEGNKYKDASTNYTENICLEMDSCYTLTIYDSYGDGMSGTFIIKNGNQTLISVSGFSGDSKSVDFCVEEDLTNIQNILDNIGANIYPNPATEKINIEINLKQNSNVKIRLYNAAGQLEKIIDKGLLTEGNHNIEVDVNRLNNGLYFAKVSIGNESVTKKIQIFK
jgi:type IX secretion system substrate protein/AhpC/TSA family protein